MPVLDVSHRRKGTHLFQDVCIVSAGEPCRQRVTHPFQVLLLTLRRDLRQQSGAGLA